MALRNNRAKNWPLVAAVVSVLTFSCAEERTPVPIKRSSHLVLIGNNLGARMMLHGHFDTELHVRYPDSTLFIRNMCDAGNTPGFRPHAARRSPWAFPGAENFQTELANYSDSQGRFETEDEWLERLKADIVLAFFGYNESFDGVAGLENFKGELRAFVRHTKSQAYNGSLAPFLVLVSPIAFERISDAGASHSSSVNTNLELYTEAMNDVASEHDVMFIDLFHASLRWYEDHAEALTIDGFQLSDRGNNVMAKHVVDQLSGGAPSRSEKFREKIRSYVLEKDWMWQNDFKIPNGVHVYGRRYLPFGPDNYPAEIEKIREMTSVRDSAIWSVSVGRKYDLVAADRRTSPLPPVQTNFQSSDSSEAFEYLYGKKAEESIRMAPGYRIDLFASEREFPDLANPSQIAFDSKGRLWVATMPSYPHYKPGDPKPDDKLIILEDTDKDGRADKQVIFARNLHLPLGFEFTPEGVYVSQGTNLVLLTDTDGDDKADKKEVVLSGFDDHDTHHCISAFCADPSGSIYMGEGVFLHSNVETAYGPVRATNGGFYRYDPSRRHLERTAQLAIPNPWGIAFDDWGQTFYLETSNPDLRWMLPGTIKPIYGRSTHKSFNLIEGEHRVRPTSGLEFVSSRHFPDEVQGDILLCNTIGFLGTKQHAIEEDGTGFKASFRQDLLRSTDPNFRPVDLEFAPDGSLYVCDWHNLLIGHMQHNARDPLRDHVHGRIYRVTYPSRPLVSPATVHGASVRQLLQNLTLPEYRTRYRSRAELRKFPSDIVFAECKKWIEGLDKTDPKYEHHLVEAIWVMWGAGRVEESLVKRLLVSEDHRVRSAAVRTIRYNMHTLADGTSMLEMAAGDVHGRVRLEAIVAATWLSCEDGLRITKRASEKPFDEWIRPAYETAIAHLNGKSWQDKQDEDIQTDLLASEKEAFIKGKEIYGREGFCITCHQPDGNGLPPSGFPPLTETKWVTGNEERLIKVVLNGMHGPLQINGSDYGWGSPMTPFGAMLSDEEIAAVLTYVRNAFGNKAPAISRDQVRQVRNDTREKKGFYSPVELLEQHPME